MIVAESMAEKWPPSSLGALCDHDTLASLEYYGGDIFDIVKADSLLYDGRAALVRLKPHCDRDWFYNIYNVAAAQYVHITILCGRDMQPSSHHRRGSGRHSDWLGRQHSETLRSRNTL